MNTTTNQECNVMLAGNKNLTVGKAGIGDDAKIGVTMETESRRAAGQQFGQTSGITAANAGNLTAFHQDTDNKAGMDGGDNKVIWGDPVCQIQNTDGSISYYYDKKADDGTGLTQAVADAKENDTIEMLVEDYKIPKAITVDNKTLTVTKASTLTTATLTNAENGANTSGMFINNGNLTFKAITMEGNGGNNQNRAVYQKAGTLTLDHVTLNNFKQTSWYGGAVAVEGGTVEVKASAITNCAGNVGGAIGTNVSTTTPIAITIEASTITGCSGRHGGALFANYSGTQFTITDCTFTGNQATSGDGGAVYLARGATVSAKGTNEITGCTASGSGGGFMRQDPM